jgi:hypothetical protein
MQKSQAQLPQNDCMCGNRKEQKTQKASRFHVAKNHF